RKIFNTVQGSAAGTGAVSAEVVGGSGAPPASESVPRSADPPAAQDSTRPPDGGEALPPQIQVNDAGQAGDEPPDAATSSSSDTKKEEKKNTSSSRKKKKKGLRKVIPF
ncbi:MAG: hypothetical protein ACRESV_06645, partial [Nevskiales bacterium]